MTAGTHLHYLLIDLRLDDPLPLERWIGHILVLQPLTALEGTWSHFAEWAADLYYPGKTSPGFVLPSRVLCRMRSIRSSLCWASPTNHRAAARKHSGMMGNTPGMRYDINPYAGTYGSMGNVYSPHYRPFHQSGISGMANAPGPETVHGQGTRYHYPYFLPPTRGSR